MKVFENLYADLRDRRMLSIALVLVAAIIAVPFLLGGSSDEDVPPPPSVAAQAPFVGDEQLDPVVLAEVPGLRDFRQRLEGYQSHNPFKSKLTDKQIRELTGGGDNGDGAGTDDGTAAAGDAGTGTDDVTIPGDTGTGAGTDPAVPSDPGTGTGTGGSGGELISYRIDVRVGPVGDTKVIKDVENLTFLPGRRDPLVQYIDADLDGDRVAFIVNPEAAAIKGNGECVRSKKDCQYLIMGDGGEMYFLFNDRQYRLEVRGINEHREPYTPGADSSSDDGSDPSAQRSLQEILQG